MTALRLTTAVAAVALISGCSVFKKAPKAPAPAPAQSTAPAPQQSSGGLVFGGPAGGRFQVPEAAKQSPPDVNTVPTEAPKPTSTKEEREKALVGLLADRQNARHSDQPARTMPVAVRPLSDQPAPPTPALQAAAARVNTPPPARPADADSASPDAAPAVPPAPPPRNVAALVGPRRAPSSALKPSADDADDSGAGDTVSTSGPVGLGAGSGFRSLTEFDATIYGTSHNNAEVALPSGTLTVAERSRLSDISLKQTQTRGVVRVIGHGSDPKAARDKAVAVARELERLGVANDQIFVGFEVGNGATEVYLHYK